ncbi:MAG: CRISPR-associated endonuclease Cas2 [Gammaproteobacteria bacterium]|nr:MAG: CRISPR-associated endonuclease Cas2 [Gammaproteobacteria bacterium]
MKHKENWYLVAYDIRDPRRMQRVHRFLKRHALPVQESVFFFQGTEGAIRRLMDEAARMLNLREDDLRAWPVAGPGEAWMYGKGMMGERLQAPGRRGWIKRLWCWLRSR